MRPRDKSCAGRWAVRCISNGIGRLEHEKLRQYKFEKLRYDYGEWFFFAFWMAIALFVSACAVQLLADAGQDCPTVTLRCVDGLPYAELGGPNTGRSGRNVVRFSPVTRMPFRRVRLPCCPKAAPEWSSRVRPCGWIRLESVPRSSGSLAGVCRGSRNAGRRLSKLAASTLSEQCRRRFARSWHCKRRALMLAPGANGQGDHAVGDRPRLGQNYSRHAAAGVRPKCLGALQLAWEPPGRPTPPRRVNDGCHDMLHTGKRG